MKPDQTPGANQDAGGIPVYPEAPGLSLDVDTLTQMLRRIDGNHNEFVARVHAERLLPLLAKYTRLSPSSGESGSPSQPFDSQARDLLEACHERNIHSRGDMEYQFQPWALDAHRLRVALERSRISHDAEPTDGLCARCGDDAETLAAEYNRVGSGSPGEDR